MILVTNKYIFTFSKYLISTIQINLLKFDKFIFSVRKL